MDEGKKHKRLRRSFTDEFTLLALAKRQDVVAARPGRRSNASARGQDSVDRARMLSECSPDFAQRLPASPPRPKLLLLSRRQAGPTASCHRATSRVVPTMRCADRLNSPRPSSRKSTTEIRLHRRGEGPFLYGPICFECSRGTMGSCSRRLRRTRPAWVGGGPGTRLRVPMA